MPLKLSEIIVERGTPWRVPPREQRKMDPGRRVCGLVATEIFISQTLDIVFASAFKIIPYFFLGRKQSAFSVLVLFSESRGAEGREKES